MSSLLKFNLFPMIRNLDECAKTLNEDSKEEKKQLYPEEHGMVKISQEKDLTKIFNVLKWT